LSKAGAVVVVSGLLQAKNATRKKDKKNIFFIV
jgi:hypothetical protein